MEGSIVGRARARTQSAAAGIMRRLRESDRRKLALYIGPPLAVLLIAIVWLAFSGGSVSTDNATVTAARAPISASVRGRVIEVVARENQVVHAGDVLVRLDTEDLQIAVTDAEARLAAARLQVEALRASYRQSIADRAAAQAQAAHAAGELRRQRALFEAGVASQRDVDNAATEANVQARESTSALQHQATALASLGGRADIATDQHPLVLQAAAALARAQGDLGDASIRAPVDGTVARVSQVQVGAYVQPAQTLFYIISGTPWVDAAFKENQLGTLRVGQPVRIHIDAFPGETFQGHVESFSPGTGSSFAVLPAENASGNWVRVVQRLNVRVAFDEPPHDAAMAIGLSANVTVDTRQHRATEQQHSDAGPALRGRAR